MSKLKEVTGAQILEAMHSYKIVINQIETIRKELNDAHAGTAQYGLQASMPKASGTSDVLFSEYLRRERMHKTLDRMKEKVTIIQMFCESSEFDRLAFKDKLILEYTLLGMSQTEIGDKEEIDCGRSNVLKRQRAISKSIATAYKRSLETLETK